MSTRSLIARQLPDGSVRHVYCHSDGYPEWVGKKLFEHYQEVETIDRLLDLGDLSCLGNTTEGRPYGSPFDDAKTVAYGRDRGETGTEARTSTSRDDFVLDAKISGSWAEYFYLFANEWQVRKSARGAEWERLEEVLQKEPVE